MTPDLVETPSGLIVPADVADAAARKPPTDGGPADFNRDPDGRRRIVFTAADQKQIDRTIGILKAAGLGLIVGCDQGHPMINEGRSTGPKTPRDLDAGYGCPCARVHFR